MVPPGVTLHDCTAVPPDAVFAVTLKLFETRDSAAVGVQLTVLPLSAAPDGDVVKVNVTLPPAGSVAASWYEYATSCVAVVTGELVKIGVEGCVCDPPPLPEPHAIVIVRHANNTMVNGRNLQSRIEIALPGRGSPTDFKCSGMGVVLKPRNYRPTASKSAVIPRQRRKHAV
jgi:hypothetical protein